MNFNLFDSMDVIMPRERESTVMKRDSDISMMNINNSKSRFPSAAPIGMAYVPFQQWGEFYSEDEGFRRGTMFPELDFPFMKAGELNE